MINDIEKRMLRIIKANPGIRPSELNRRLGLEHSNYYRQKLIKQGLIIKKSQKAATYYYPVK